MKNKIIERWFQSWFDPNWNEFDDIFESEIYYSESWGPEYYGINEIKTWKNNWHEVSYLKDWKIKKISHLDYLSFVEWYFCCFDDEGKHEFDGVSIIEWGIDHKIKSLKEFGSSLPKYNPVKKSSDFNDKYPYGCLEININDLDNRSGLSIACTFNKKDILRKDLKTEIFHKVHENCKQYKVWALLGGNFPDKYICLQVASSVAIEKEIISDIECMIPFDESKDIKSWTSQFHKEEIFKVKYGLDVRCQKYNDMYKRFNYFCILLIDSKLYLKDIDIKDFNLDHYAEVKYANDTKALYWNPNHFKNENAILKELCTK